MISFAHQQLIQRFMDQILQNKYYCYMPVQMVFKSTTFLFFGTALMSHRKTVWLLEVQQKMPSEIWVSRKPIGLRDPTHYAPTATEGMTQQSSSGRITRDSVIKHVYLL